MRAKFPKFSGAVHSFGLLNESIERSFDLSALLVCSFESAHLSAHYMCNLKDRSTSIVKYFKNLLGIRILVFFPQLSVFNISIILHSHSVIRYSIIR